MVDVWKKQAETAEKVTAAIAAGPAGGEGGGPAPEMTLPDALRHHGPSLLAVAAVVLVATWPLAHPSVLTGAAVGHPYGDLADHYWGTWWFGGELLAGRCSVFAGPSGTGTQPSAGRSSCRSE